ncbi:hypothetical protein CapIbe_012703 [Capra ibex]
MALKPCPTALTETGDYQKFLSLSYRTADGETNSQRALRSCSRQDGSEKISRYVILEKGYMPSSTHLCGRLLLVTRHRLLRDS